MSRGGWMERAFPRDRISQLPDTICLHILSLLPRRFAIRTGVLSNRWRDLWKYRFPRSIGLNFDDQFTFGKTPKQVGREIDSILSHYEKNKIETFRFLFREHLNRKKVESWIRRVVSNGLEEFYFSFSQDLVLLTDEGGFSCRIRKFDLDRNLFRNNLLVILSLDFCNLRQNFSFASFASLEVLRLCGVDITDNMLVKLVSNSPLLESMDLVECNQLRHIKVSALRLRLKRLAIINCWQAEAVEVCAWKLRSFHFHGRFPTRYKLSGTSSLVDLIITSSIEDYWRWVEASMDLEIIEVLTLCSKGLQYVFGSTVSKFGFFRGLRELQLFMVQMTNGNIDDIYGFFGNYDFSLLEKLFIELPTTSDDSSLQHFMEVAENPPPERKFERLATVKLNNFKAHRNEALLVRYFLKSAPILDKILLVLNQESRDKDVLPVWNAIPTMEKASRDAQVMMLWDDDDSLIPTHKQIYCKESSPTKREKMLANTARGRHRSNLRPPNRKQRVLTIELSRLTRVRNSPSSTREILIFFILLRGKLANTVRENARQHNERGT